METLSWYLWILGFLFVTGMGIIPFIPEEAAVIAVAGWVTSNQLHVILGWLCCIIGIIGTDVVLYAIGRFGGPRLFASRLGRYFIGPERRARIADGFHRHGIKFLLSGRLLPGVRTGIFISAGAIHYPLWRFVIADAVAIPVISFFYMLGYFASEAVRNMFVGGFDQVKLWLLLFAVLGISGFLGYRYIKYLKQRNDGEPGSLAELPANVVAQIEGVPVEQESTSSAQTIPATSHDPSPVTSTEPAITSKTH